MGQYSGDIRAVWLPVIVLGYMETLRRATFYAFGWQGSGQALTVIGILVLIYIHIDCYYPSRPAQALSGGAIFLYAGLVGVGNSADLSNPSYWIPETVLGLPDFGLGSLTSLSYSAFSVVVVVFYGLLVFLVTVFILEKKSVFELFLAGSVLLAVEIIASDQGMVGYLATNMFFGLLLKCQILFLELENDTRVRFVGGAGLRSGFWVLASAVLGIFAVVLSFVLPAAKTRFDLAAAGSELVSQVAYQPTVLRWEQKGEFDRFWGMMEGFEVTGAISLEDHPVMYVKSPAPFYWRGESSDYYTGSGWESRLTSRLVPDGEFSNPYARQVAVSKVEQAFILAPDMSSQVVFSAGSPAHIGAACGQLVADDGGNAYADNIEPGKTYRVTSYVPEFNPDKLKRTPEEYPVEIKKTYLQLPENLPDRVRELAAGLTEKAGSRYEKVRIIERYLSWNYPYELEVPGVPASRDVTDYFLFDLKKGYCTYHSTAMVVMLRSIGIPARWVKGFTTGDYDPETESFRVSMKNAHAWVEVYFSSYGWLPFEPTSGFKLSAGAADGETGPVDAPELSGAEVPKKEASAAILNRQEKEVSWKLIVFAVVVLAAALLVYIKKRTVSKPSYGSRMKTIYMSYVNLLAQMGYPKDTAQTPSEFASILAGEFRDDYLDILSITNFYMKDRYDRKGLNETELEEAQAAWERLSTKWQGKSRD